MADPVLEAAQECTSPGHHYSLVHDIARQLRRGLVKRVLDRLNDLRHGFVDRLPYLLCRHDHGLRKPRREIPSLYLALQVIVPKRERRTDVDLQHFRGPLPDHQLVIPLDVVDYRLVHLVAADPDRLARDDAPQRDDRDLGGPPSDVNHHVAYRLVDGKAGADRCGHRPVSYTHLRAHETRHDLVCRLLLEKKKKKKKNNYETTTNNT